MLKDMAVVYDQITDTFFVFSSHRWVDGEPDAQRPQPFYSSPDLLEFERHFDDDLPLASSPDVIPDPRGEGWLMTFQLPIDNPPPAHRLFLSSSPDGERWMLGYKWEQLPAVQISLGNVIDSGWSEPSIVEPGALLQFAENQQFLMIDGVWRVLATGRHPEGPQCDSPIYTCNHAPFLFTVRGAAASLGDWIYWDEKTWLEVATEDWNTEMHANSAYLADWRHFDGWFYLFYAGSNDSDTFSGRGHGKIGVSRSRDLHTWYPAGQPEAD